MTTPKIEALSPAAQVDCAVLLALSGIPGTRMEVLLALPHREGRHPVIVLETAPTGILWRCADGVVEQPALSTADQDYTILLEEIALNGLLVAEYDDLDAEGARPRNHWLIEATGELVSDEGDVE